MKALAYLASVSVAMSLQHGYANAQPRQAQEPRFEVASVKANRSGARLIGAAGFQPGGRFQVVNGTARVLIAHAYLPGNARVVGLPSWAETERFDVLAKARSSDTRAVEMRAMIRNLLAERFQFLAHFEEREESTFSMVLVDKNKLGPQIRKVDFDCDAFVEAVSEGRMALSDVPIAPNGVLGCTSQSRFRKSGGGTITTLQSGGTRLSDLAGSMRGRVGRAVLDKTGLDGFYEYTIEYTDDPASTNVPSFVSALSEQLGLRLVSDRGMVRVLVIDRIERPTPD